MIILLIDCFEIVSIAVKNNKNAFEYASRRVQLKTKFLILDLCL